MAALMRFHVYNTAIKGGRMGSACQRSRCSLQLTGDIWSRRVHHDRRWREHPADSSSQPLLKIRDPLALLAADVAGGMSLWWGKTKTAIQMRATLASPSYRKVQTFVLWVLHPQLSPCVPGGSPGCRQLGGRDHGWVCAPTMAHAVPSSALPGALKPRITPERPWSSVELRSPELSHRAHGPVPLSAHCSFLAEWRKCGFILHSGLGHRDKIILC